MERGRPDDGHRIGQVREVRGKVDVGDGDTGHANDARSDRGPGYGPPPVGRKQAVWEDEQREHEDDGEEAQLADAAALPRALFLAKEHEARS